MLAEAGAVLEQLLDAATREGRFHDAARHTLQIGQITLAQVISRVLFLVDGCLTMELRQVLSVQNRI